MGGELAPGDSLKVAYPIAVAAPGRYIYGASVRFSAFQDTSENRVSWKVLVSAFLRQVVVLWRGSRWVLAKGL